MVTICQTCGDEGFSNALIFCDECQIYAVHVYCFAVLPASFDEYMVWLCEDCAPDVRKSPSHDKLNTFQVSENDSESSESVQVNKRNNTNNLKKKSKKRKNANNLKKKSKRREVDICPLPKPEVPCLEKSNSVQLHDVACSKTIEKDQEFGGQHGLDECTSNEAVESLESRSPELDAGVHQPIDMNCSDNGQKDDKYGRQNVLDEASINEVAECNDKNSNVAIPLEANLAEDGGTGQKHDEKLNCMEENCSNEETEGLNSLEKSRLHGEAESPKTKNTQLTRCDMHALEMDSCEDGEIVQDIGGQNNFDESSIHEEAELCDNKYQLVVVHEPNNVEHSCVHAQPIKEPVWRGSLSISNNISTMIGLVAHVSKLACPMVSDEAKLMPASLSPELLPRSAVWPKGFRESGPRDDSIALYFFPDSERNEKVFDRLVNDMINRDVAMRAVVQNAELLIFSSTMLPVDLWRFQAKFYLWGVFKGKRSPRTTVDAVPEEEICPLNSLTCDRQSSASPLSNGSNVF